MQKRSGLAESYATATCFPELSKNAMKRSLLSMTFSAGDPFVIDMAGVLSLLVGREEGEMLKEICKAESAGSAGSWSAHAEKNKEKKSV